MTDYTEVVDRLVAEGYLSEADADAAIIVLSDALIIAEAQEAELEALEDMAFQEELIEEAADLGDAAAAMGDMEIQEEVVETIEEALDTEAIDAAIIDTAEALIDAAYTEAAAALVTAELIDEENREAAASAIADTV